MVLTKTLPISSRAAPLERRSGPTLRDGTQLRDLIDFDKREVSMRVLSDPEIYRLELKRIFARSWICLGHVAEIPNPGDFVKRAIGEDAVIVGRGRDGEVSVVLNACAHRGMEICRADSGNQASFKCPYHGWVFDHSGKLMGAPFEREMYGDWDKSHYGLRKARCEIFYGRIFANFDLDAEPLDEWLDAAGYHLARPYQGVDPEMEIIESPRRFRIPSNWKLASDNNTGDGYHGMTLHASLTEMGFASADHLDGMNTVKVSSDRGHGLFGFQNDAFAVLTGVKKDEGANPDRYAVDNIFFSVMLFPASFGIGASANRRVPMPDGGGFIIASMGGSVPCGPGGYELWHAGAIEKSAPEPLKTMLRKMGAMVDIGGADDMEAWPSITRVSEGAMGAEQKMRFNSIAGENRPAEWPGPGLIYAGLSKDDNQWNFWRRWFDMMSHDEACGQ